MEFPNICHFVIIVAPRVLRMVRYNEVLTGLKWNELVFQVSRLKEKTRPIPSAYIMPKGKGMKAWIEKYSHFAIEQSRISQDTISY